MAGRVSTAPELACTGQGGEALPSPPTCSFCNGVVSPQPAFGVCRWIAAHLVQDLGFRVGFRGQKDRD